MRAIDSLLEEFVQFIPFVHAARRKALLRAVRGVIGGGHLWLTGLGRDLPGETSDKYRIKAADRVLGNAALHRELPRLYGALMRWLLRGMNRPLIVVDWTGLRLPYFALTAALCCEGRALPLYSEVHEEIDLADHRIHRQFLRTLRAQLPAGCKPIVLTDAGFYANWFEAVAEMGWDYVGRVRGTVHAVIDGRWKPIKSLYERACDHSLEVGEVMMRRRRPRSFRFVLSAAPKGVGRQRLSHRGKRRRATTDKRCGNRANEPWLLATSLKDPSERVVSVYVPRMQIEETFRDEKNHRYGWALRHARSRSAARLDVLLFLAAVAVAIVQSVGRAAENKGLHHRFQANTVRTRRVLSWFVLGRMVLQRAAADIEFDALRVAFHLLLERAASNGQQLAGTG